MDEGLFDEKNEQIQKDLNDAKRQEIAEKYGAHFSEPSPELPADMEAQWLHNIEAFESQWENARRVPVREFLDNPTFKHFDEIKPEDLESELDAVLEFLEAKGIAVDFLDGVSDKDIYEFVTSELLEEEIDDVHVDGMMCHFIYEDFHPNDVYDAKFWVTIFLEELFARRFKNVVDCFAKDEMYDGWGKQMSYDQAMALVKSFYSKYALFTEHQVECTDCTLDGDYATVRVKIQWSALLAGTMDPVLYKEVGELRVKRSPYGGYNVVKARILGLTV
ncbi:MAG: hypothetical protein WBD36_04765 [Bacteroidota bacterium]